MPRSKLKVHIFDLYDPITAVYAPQLFTRIRDFGYNVTRNPNAEVVAKTLLARTAMRDPDLLIVFAAQDEKVIVHAVAEVITVDGCKICFFGQYQVDIPGAAYEYFYVVKNWAKSKDCSIIRTECVAEVFNEKTAARCWAKFGYKLVSYGLELKLD